MKILMVGAGALGGYFGGRLIEAGQDVTYLLRAGRIEQLKKTNGLHVKSELGDMSFPNVNYLTSDEIKEPFDLIIVSCKAYSLDACMESFAPAVGEDTMILPVLNGIQHIDVLVKRFGLKHVLGGVARISATLDADGNILHLNKNHDFVFGELDGSSSSRIQKVKTIFEKAKFSAQYSDNMMQALWNKWVFITTAVGATCLFRGAISDIIQAGGASYIQAMLDEAAQVAKHCGYGLDEVSYENTQKMLINPNSHLIASMAHDMEKGNAIESYAIIDNLIERMPENERSKLPMLKLVSTTLKTYEVRKRREA